MITSPRPVRRWNVHLLNTTHHGVRSMKEPPLILRPKTRYPPRIDLINPLDLPTTVLFVSNTKAKMHPPLSAQVNPELIASLLQDESPLRDGPFRP